MDDATSLRYHIRNLSTYREGRRRDGRPQRPPVMGAAAPAPSPLPYLAGGEAAHLGDGSGGVCAFPFAGSGRRGGGMRWRKRGGGGRQAAGDGNALLSPPATK
uniref:Uncharacterized protein n=1 Tax=Oryza sativa subsp. japonica TaxID=39947 RepID=Q6ZH26_ORYSJ|nr:hypothetical protein [Oryza sativa Japonica Group]